MHNVEIFDQVFIRDLTIEMFAGIYDHEKKNKQRVIINITLDVLSNEGQTLSSIDDVVSYESIANQIRDIACAKHYDLLEEFGELIAISCLKQGKVRAARIRIEKPDIIKDTKSVGIEITRKNS